jgi:cytochrome c5
MKTITPLLATISALAIAIGSAAQSKSAKPAAKSADSQVVQIKLPIYPGEIPKGPNVEVYEKNCLLCHGSRYVAMQPNFPRATWQKEVKKMIDAYGANVPEADQPLIVDYLVAVKGVGESKPPDASK